MPADPTDVRTCTLEEVAAVGGTVVVVDVLRAFTTAAEAMAQGPAAYELVGTLADARARRDEDPAVQLVGEVDGQRPADFEHSNSPLEMAAADVAGVPLVHRSSAGTQGVVRAASASRLLVASLVVASATAAVLAPDEPVTYCITGASLGRDGDEDLVAAEVVEGLRRGLAPDVDAVRERVRASSAGRMFADPAQPWLDPADLERACEVDRHALAMEVGRDGGRHRLHAVRPAG